MSRRFLLLLLLPLGLGCVLKGTHTETVARNIELSSQLTAVTKERDALKTQLDEQGRQLSELEARNEELSNTNQRLVGKNADFARKAEEDQQEIVRIRQEKADAEERARALSRGKDELARALKEELAGGQAQILLQGERLSVVLSDSLLFQAGSEKIQPAGAKALKKLVPTLRNFKERPVSVEGHAEEGGAAPKKPAANAWELSARKAVRVVRFLEEAGLDPQRMSAVGWGVHHPTTGLKNRGVEIVLPSP